MIGILQNKRLNSAKMKKILKWYWEVVSGLMKKSKYQTKSKRSFDDIENDLKSINPQYTLEYICKAPYSELLNIKAQIDANVAFKTHLNTYIKNDKGAKHLMIALYEEMRSSYGNEIVEKLEISVCPYCNRNYINNGKTRAMAQFDHFISKSENPVFAVSFYNLIPCCATCNHTKGDKHIDISPYNARYSTDKLIEFNYYPVAVGKYGVLVKERIPDMKSNISVFLLNDQYQIHYDLVAQLIYKTEKYNEANIEALYKNLPLNLNMTAKELYYDNYLSEDKYYLRPLSKFTKDIIDRINAIK